ncbi:hypothetical protein M407DRAFT_47979, partial [Tulasnella calospora MUT 4182]
LIPLDAPIQSRNYITPSATSRKDIPPSVARTFMNRRREMDPEKVALLEHVEQARRRNTLAARKSRQRKLEHVRNLEEDVEGLRAE